MTEYAEDFAAVSFMLDRPNAPDDFVSRIVLQKTIGMPDDLQPYLNFLSEILKSAGFDYLGVGVRYKVGGVDGEHWSDY